jgi:hypothetical protein
MKDIAAGLAALGRGPDTMLVHMAPGEVAGLQSLAKAHGGSLTLNPHTGLPEAGFLSNILPALAAAAAIYFTGGAAAGAGAAGAGAAGAGAAGAGGLFGLGSTAAGTGALAGAATGALTNKENPLMGAVMGGLSGWGMGGAMGALGQTGAEAINAANAASDKAIAEAVLAEGSTPGAFSATGLGQLPTPGAFSATGIATPPATAAQNYAAGLKQLTTPDGLSQFGTALGKQYGNKYGQMAAGIGALGALGGFEQPKTMQLPEEKRSDARLAQPFRRPYDPTAPGGYYFTDYGTLRPTYAAKGGEMHSAPQLEDGGFVLTKRAIDGIGGGSNEAGQRRAAAGLGAIPIRGPGTGTSDSLLTTIDGKYPARISNGEAYVPRDQVKRRGGAKKFYSLMKQAEKAARA